MHSSSETQEERGNFFFIFLKGTDVLEDALSSL